ncbi:MAG TPA: methyltransferase domain-containing protein [Pirellulales bacterium]|nr:methyltransferase domain-containing protein [Pirellulales bacterium]
MSTWFHDHRVFWRQFREQFHTTGAVLPSGRFLGRALARYVGHGAEPARVLEVGPGTGAVTANIVKRLGPQDRLDLVELNDDFVRRLRDRLTSDQPFVRVAERTRVLHQRVEDLPPGEPYDLIISGLPLNNFAVSDVERILDVFATLLRRGGTLSFFEYIAIRPVRALVSGPAERARLRGIGEALSGILKPYEIGRDWIWPNVPPAWVHHCRLPATATGKTTCVDAR